MDDVRVFCTYDYANIIGILSLFLWCWRNEKCKYKAADRTRKFSVIFVSIARLAWADLSLFLNLLTSQSSLTFLEPITTASLSSTILWDNLCLTTKELVISKSSEFEVDFLYENEGGSVVIGLDTGLGGESPCSFLALTKTVTVVLGSKFLSVYDSICTLSIVSQWDGLLRV